VTAVHRGMIQPQAVGRTVLHQLAGTVYHLLSFAPPKHDLRAAMLGQVMLEETLLGADAGGNQVGKHSLGRLLSATTPSDPP
jgi:hypothetical protein